MLREKAGKRWTQEAVVAGCSSTCFLTPVFGRPRQEDHERKALGYLVRHCTAIQGGQGMVPFLPLSLIVFSMFRLGVGASGRVNLQQLASVAGGSDADTGPTLLILCRALEPASAV